MVWLILFLTSWFLLNKCSFVPFPPSLFAAILMPARLLDSLTLSWGLWSLQTEAALKSQISTAVGLSFVKRPPNLFPQGKLVILEDTGSHRDKKKKNPDQGPHHALGPGWCLLTCICLFCCSSSHLTWNTTGQQKYMALHASSQTVLLPQS